MVMRKRVAIAAALATAVLCGVAQAGVIYKQVERDGKITFSDHPLDGAVVISRIESSDSPKPGVAEETRGAGAPQYQYLALADGFDEAVRQANTKVDMAEHALAVARRSLLGNHDPLALANGRSSPEALHQLEFYKDELGKARKNLLRTIQQRNILAPRPVA